MCQEEEEEEEEEEENQMVTELKNLAMVLFVTHIVIKQRNLSQSRGLRKNWGVS